MALSDYTEREIALALGALVPNEAASLRVDGETGEFSIIMDDENEDPPSLADLEAQIVNMPEVAAERIAETKRSVVRFADELAEKITGPVPQSEKLGWIKKEEAARAHAAGTATAAQTAFLNGELSLTGAIDGDLDSLSAKIIANADFYSIAVGAISGVRRSTMAAIDALGSNPTQAQLDAVVATAQASAQSQFATVMSQAP